MPQTLSTTTCNPIVEGRPNPGLPSYALQKQGFEMFFFVCFFPEQEHFSCRDVARNTHSTGCFETLSFLGIHTFHHRVEAWKGREEMCRLHILVTNTLSNSNVKSSLSQMYQMGYKYILKIELSCRWMPISHRFCVVVVIGFSRCLYFRNLWVVAEVH